MGHFTKLNQKDNSDDNFKQSPNRKINKITVTFYTERDYMIETLLAISREGNMTLHYLNSHGESPKTYEIDD